jgi:hypothetical protein
MLSGPDWLKKHAEKKAALKTYKKKSGYSEKIETELEERERRRKEAEEPIGPF